MVNYVRFDYYFAIGIYVTWRSVYLQKLDESEPVVIIKQYILYEVPVYWNIPTDIGILDIGILDIGIQDMVTVIDMVILHED